MTIKPIRSEEDHDRVLARIDELWGAEPGTPEGDELEVLVTLSVAYEEDRHPIGLPDPIDAIVFRLEQSGRPRADLERVLGGKQITDEVLGRQRPLSLRMIRALHAEFGIPADILIQGPPSPPPARALHSDEMSMSS